MTIVRVCAKWFVLAGLILVILYSFTKAIGAMSAQSLKENVSELKNWRTEHQSADNEQFRRLNDIDKTIAAMALTQEVRLTKLEIEFTSTSDELKSISARIWAALGAIGAQVMNLLWAYTWPRKKYGHRKDDKPLEKK